MDHWVARPPHSHPVTPSSLETSSTTALEKICQKDLLAKLPSQGLLVYFEDAIATTFLSGETIQNNGWFAPPFLSGGTIPTLGWLAPPCPLILWIQIFPQVSVLLVFYSLYADDFTLFQFPGCEVAILSEKKSASSSPVNQTFLIIISIELFL